MISLQDSDHTDHLGDLEVTLSPASSRSSVSDWSPVSVMWTTSEPPSPLMSPPMSSASPASPASMSASVRPSFGAVTHSWLMPSPEGSMAPAGPAGPAGKDWSEARDGMPSVATDREDGEISENAGLELETPTLEAKQPVLARCSEPKLPIRPTGAQDQHQEATLKPELDHSPCTPTPTPKSRVARPSPTEVLQLLFPDAVTPWGLVTLAFGATSSLGYFFGTLFALALLPPLLYFAAIFFLITTAAHGADFALRVLSKSKSAKIAPKGTASVLWTHVKAEGASYVPALLVVVTPYAFAPGLSVVAKFVFITCGGLIAAYTTVTALLYIVRAAGCATRSIGAHLYLHRSVYARAAARMAKVALVIAVASALVWMVAQSILGVRDELASLRAQLAEVRRESALAARFVGTTVQQRCKQIAEERGVKGR